MKIDFHNRNCIQVLRLVFFKADTTTIRLSLGLASAGYALLLVWPILWPMVAHLCPSWLDCLRPTVQSYFGRPAFSVMAVVPGGEWTWFVLLMLHFAGVLWRIVETRPRERWAIAINSLGFGLWLYSTIAINVGLGRATPTAALEWVVIFFAGWALFRTGTGDELTTP